MSLETLARKMMLTPSQAVALPATIDCAASAMGMNRPQMLMQCVGNPALCEYLASICRKVS